MSVYIVVGFTIYKKEDQYVDIMNVFTDKINAAIFVLSKFIGNKIRVNAIDSDGYKNITLNKNDKVIEVKNNKYIIIQREDGSKYKYIHYGLEDKEMLIILDGVPPIVTFVPSNNETYGIGIYERKIIK